MTVAGVDSVARCVHRDRHAALVLCRSLGFGAVEHRSSEALMCMARQGPRRDVPAAAPPG